MFIGLVLIERPTLGVRVRNFTRNSLNSLSRPHHVSTVNVLFVILRDKGAPR